jgi:hypothetical protein
MRKQANIAKVITIPAPFHGPALVPEHICQYQAGHVHPVEAGSNTVTQRLAALRFFYIQVLKQGWNTAETAYWKKVLHLPQPTGRTACGRDPLVVESCRRLKIPVRDYLGDILLGLANTKMQRVADLTPDAWAARHTPANL